MNKQTEALKLALEAAYLAGFNASGEGYNAEYPFGDHARNPEEDAAWIKDRDNALRKALAEQTAPMIRGDIRDGLVDDEPAQQQEPEFIKHEVENADDWSEWVCPDPKGYLMKCCDCGLVHEAEFGVVRYKSETEREDCDMVDDPNLQAVFRMRRSEKWSPEDTANRVEGLPLEQPAQQEPVAITTGMALAFHRALTDGPINDAEAKEIKIGLEAAFAHLTTQQSQPAQQEPVAYASDVEFDDETEIIPAEQKGKLGTAGLRIPLYIDPPASKPWVVLTNNELQPICDEYRILFGSWVEDFAKAIETKLREKNHG